VYFNDEQVTHKFSPLRGIIFPRPRLQVRLFDRLSRAMTQRTRNHARMCYLGHYMYSPIYLSKPPNCVQIDKICKKVPIDVEPIFIVCETFNVE